MKRRSFLEMFGGTVLAANIQSSADKSPLLDRYGGLLALSFPATGYFRLEKSSRWWFVTPEGHAFLQFGLNHAVAGFLMNPYNKTHWAGEFGLPPDADAGAFYPGFVQKLKQDVAALGFNSLGCHTRLNDSVRPFMPYVANIPFLKISHFQTPSESDFPDVFTKDFEIHCDTLARREAAPLRDDPWLLGYYCVDGPIFTEQEAAVRDTVIYGAARPGVPTFPRVLRNLGEDSPGKRVYVETVRELYSNDIQRFNNAYNTGFRSFDGLLQARNWKLRTDPGNSREERDNMAFLLKVMDRYHLTAVAAIKRYDSHHLIYGDKLNGNVEQPDEILRSYARHYDLLLLQLYSNWYDLDKWITRITEVTGKPVLLGDASFSVPYAEMPNPLGPQCADQDIRARHVHESLYHAFARPEFIGWDWCGWMDRWEVVQPLRQHAGLQNPFGAYDQPIAVVMKQFSEDMYDVAMGKWREK